MKSKTFTVINITSDRQRGQRGIVQTWAVVNRNDPTDLGVMVTFTTRDDARRDAARRNQAIAHNITHR